MKILMILLCGLTIQIGYSNDNNAALSQELQIDMNKNNVEYDKSLSFNENDFLNFKIIKRFENSFLFTNNDESINLWISLADDAQKGYLAITSNNDGKFGSNSANKSISNFVFFQIGDVAFPYFKEKIYFLRGNLYIHMQVISMNNIGIEDDLIKLANEVDRKICEVNGLPIPPVIETREELFKRAKEAKEQTTKVNTNKSSLNNSNNNKAKPVVTEKKEEAKSEVVSEPAKMLKGIWGVLGLLGIAIIGGMSWKIKSIQKPKE